MKKRADETRERIRTMVAEEPGGFVAQVLRGELGL
jgi:hypothetical protein